MDRAELLGYVRELIELDRGFGVEFVPRAPAAGPPAPAPAAVTGTRVAAPTAPPMSAPAAPTLARSSRPPSEPKPTPAPAVAAPRAAPPPVRPAAVGSALPVPAAAAPAPDPAAASSAAAGLRVEAGDTLARVAAAIAACRACGLCEGRTQTVPGEGHAQPDLLFIGEAPGADEDAQGRPFVGAAGQLLDRMIQAMGLSRGEVFIANVLKCRPPGNRTPDPAEVQACMPFLRRQVALLAPKVICTLGNVPLRALFGADQPGITKSRGQLLRWEGITVIPTFHPSYLLRTEQAKKPAWEDLQLVLKTLGREPPRRGAGKP